MLTDASHIAVIQHPKTKVQQNFNMAYTLKASFFSV